MKKLLAFWLCVLLVLPVALMGCNGEKNNGVVTTPETTPTQTTPIENPPQNPPVESDEARYNRALTLLGDGNIEDAYAIFLTIQDYADVPTYLSYFVFKAEEHTYQTFDPKYGTHYNYRYEYDECGRNTITESLNVKNGGTTIYFDQYDANGLLVQTGKINADGTTYGVTTYEYDEKGRPIRQEGPLGILGGVTVLEYDEDGNIIKVIGPDGDVRERIYDTDGNIIEELYKNARGDMRKTVYEYNSHGDLVKRTTQNEVDVYEYEYDEQGNKIKFVYDGGWYEWEYDDNGNEIKYTSYHTANDFVTFYFTYDENGNMTEYRREDETGITGYMYTTYDAYGNELERRDTDKNGNLTSISIYKGYKLYYNPNPQKPLPEEMVGKG